MDANEITIDAAHVHNVRHDTTDTNHNALVERTIDWWVGFRNDNGKAPISYESEIMARTVLKSLSDAALVSLLNEVSA